MKVLLSEPIREAGMRNLEENVEVFVSPDPSEHSVGELLKDVEAICLR